MLERVTLHWILQTVGSYLIAAGFAVIIASKYPTGKPNFATWHGIFGLKAIIGAAGTIIGDIVAKYSFPIRQIIRPVTAKVLHSLLGAIVYILMIFTVLLGLYSKWFKGSNGIHQLQR